MVWWHSTFSHQRKARFRLEDSDVALEDGITLRLIESGEYRHNFSFRRYLHDLRFALYLLKRMQCEEPPDIVVAATPPVLASYLAVAFSRARGVPVILDVQDVWPDAIELKMPKVLRRLAGAAFFPDRQLARRAVRNATALTATSKGFLERCVRDARREPSPLDRVTYLGYPAITKDRPAPLNRPSDHLRVSYVGSFGRSYEIALVIEVARRFLNEGLSDVTFTLAGDGEQAVLLHRLAAGLPNVHFAGWLDQAQITALLLSSDIGLVPCNSDVDTMPNKPFEYFAAGLPVVSSLKGEMRVLLERESCGLTYDSGDASALFRCIVDLKDNPILRRRLAANASRVFSSSFSAEVVYRQAATFVEQVAGYG